MSINFSRRRAEGRKKERKEKNETG